MKTTIVLAGLILVLFVEGSSGAFCSESDKEECNEMVAQTLSDLFYSEIFAYLTEEQFTEKCRDLRAYKECFESFKEYCDTSEIISYEGAIEAFTYACDNSDVYVRNNECFSLPSVKNGDDECVTAYAQDDQNFCNSVDSLNKCIKDVLTEHCSSEIAEWQYTFDTKLYAPSKELQGCDDGDGFPLSTGAIVGCALASVAVLGCIVGVIIWCKKRSNSPVVNNRGHYPPNGMHMHQRHSIARPPGQSMVSPSQYYVPPPHMAPRPGGYAHANPAYTISY